MILGAQGVLGAHLSREFAAAGWDVIPTGRKPDPRPEFRRLDLREGWMIAAAIADADVVVNTVPDESTTAERIVLREGGILINVSALPATASWKLRRERPDPSGIVVMNAGIAPGVTNLVAAELLAAHPEADEVELVFTVSSEATVGRAGREFAHRGLTSVGHHRTTVVPLPEPFGERRCLGFAEPERGWLGRGRRRQAGEPVPVRRRGGHAAVAAGRQPCAAAVATSPQRAALATAGPRAPLP